MQVTQIVVGLLLSLFIGPSLKAQSMSFDQWERTIIEPQLYGGRPATAQELPHVFWLGFCTATLVADNVVITAAHCVTTGQRISFKTRAGATVNGVCTQHPRYDDNGMTNNDFALCKLGTELKDIVKASISTETMIAGQRVVMNGYGRPNIQVLHVGESVIRSVGNQDYTTRSAVALGGGDSGGSLFKGPIADLAKGPFVVVGINSRRQVGGETSYFNITGLKRSVDFFKDYAARNSVQLCGINATCGGPIETPERCLADVEMVKYFEAETAMAKLALNACVAN
jgi:hypothetical protein